MHAQMREQYLYLERRACTRKCLSDFTLEDDADDMVCKDLAWSNLFVYFTSGGRNAERLDKALTCDSNNLHVHLDTESNK